MLKDRRDRSAGLVHLSLPRLADPHTPSQVAARLPKALIHDNIAGSRASTNRARGDGPELGSRPEMGRSAALDPLQRAPCAAGWPFAIPRTAGALGSR